MTKLLDCDSEGLRDRPIEITEEMIQAGVLEAREYPLGSSLTDLVRNVFIAMTIESRSR